MIRTILAEFAAFLTAPRLRRPAGLRTRDDWRCWAVMVALYALGLAIIGPALALWSHALHLPAPDAFGHFSSAVLVPTVVIAAPVGEEVLFRGWLTGRPRALWLLAMATVIAVQLAAIEAHAHEQVASLMVLAAMLAAAAGWWVLRRRSTVPRWFARAYPLWFGVSVGVFALSHLANYPHVTGARLLLMLPLVLPQLWAGLVFGYLRLRLGLPAAIMAHSVGNAAALSVALLSGLW